jgi:2-polyprenyl-3-methyl-5-hydroxy-6-metoxy-1,4-benzoquinol methylase
MDDQPNTGIARVEHYRKIHSGEQGVSDHYRDIPIFAHKGLHEFVGGYMKQLGLLKAGNSVVDLACGGGAMSQRLADNGLKVIALDAVPENCRASSPLLSNKGADLNQKFEDQAGGPHDLAVAMEIIEHIENPRAFLRSCFACLKPGGTLILSTPNIDSSYSIVSFALKERFSRYEDSYLEEDGHIMPLCRHQLLAAATDAGFTLAAESACGTDSVALRAWPKFWVLLELTRRFRNVPPEREGSIGIFALKRPA